MLSYNSKKPKEDLANLKKLRKARDNVRDYIEGGMDTDDQVAYLGTTNNKRHRKKHLREEQVISYYRDRPTLYLGKVLNPERRNEDWSYEKDQAFMLGAIEARKTFILVTPKSEYNQKFLTLTIDELLWLKDNGYTFSDGKNDTLICTPPTKRRDDFIIRNYHCGTGLYNPKSMNQARKEIFGFAPKTYLPAYQQSQPVTPVVLPSSIKKIVQQSQQPVTAVTTPLIKEQSVGDSINSLVGSLTKVVARLKI